MAQEIMFRRTISQFKRNQVVEIGDPTFPILTADFAAAMVRNGNADWFKDGEIIRQPEPVVVTQGETALESSDVESQPVDEVVSEPEKVVELEKVELPVIEDGPVEQVNNNDKPLTTKRRRKK